MECKEDIFYSCKGKARLFTRNAQHHGWHLYKRLGGVLRDISATI